MEPQETEDSNEIHSTVDILSVLPRNERTAACELSSFITEAVMEEGSVGLSASTLG